jgi:MFS family permease
VNNSTIQRLFISRFMAALADQIMLFAVPVIIYSQTKSIALSGLAFFAEWLPRVISLPVAGSLSDRLGSRFVYLGADAVRAITCLLVFAAIYFFQAGYFVALTAYMAISAFFYAQSYISLESLIPRLVTTQDLPKAQSKLQALEQSAMILGPIIGAVVLAKLDAVYILLLVSFLYSIAFSGILLLNIPNTFSSARRTEKLMSKVSNDIFKAWRIIKVRQSLIFLTLLSISINLIFGITLATAAAMTTGYFERTTMEFGLMQTTTGVFTIICLLAVPFFLKRTTAFHLGVFAYLAVVFCSLVINGTNYFWLYLTCYIAIHAIGGWFNIFIRTERILWIPKPHLGKTIGLIVFFNQLTLPIAGLLVSLTNSEAQAKTLFGVLALFALLVIAFTFHKLKSSSRILTQYA